jgi:hypothetical protein
MFIINAPMFFTGCWSAIKLFLDAKTVDKIKILGSNYKPELLKYVYKRSYMNFRLMNKIYLIFWVDLVIVMVEDA